MIIGMFMPLQVIMIPLAILVRDFHLTNTYGALILPYIAIGLPFSSMIFYGFLIGIPKEIEEAACMDGANIYRLFLKIIMPLALPAIATVAMGAVMTMASLPMVLVYLFLSEQVERAMTIGSAVKG